MEREGKKMSQTMRKFLVGAAGLAALVLSACDERTPLIETERYSPHRATVPRGDRSKVPIVRRSSFDFQTSKRTYETVLEAVQFEEERGNFRIYSGKITSISEKDGGVSSALLAVEGKDSSISLSLGDGSYYLTDGLCEKNFTGLFDPNGKPSPPPSGVTYLLPKEKCQPGDEVTVVAWRKDFPWGDQVVNEPIPKIPVRAFGNKNRKLYRCSAELLRYFRLGDDLMY